MRLVDDYILRYDETRRTEYLILSDFILSVSEDVYVEKKYGEYLFYSAFNRAIAYIHFDSKRQFFYIGFTDGKKLKDFHSIFDSDDMKTVSKWFLETIDKLEMDEIALRDLLHQAVEYNRIKSIKH